jgi:hypothetical protein
MSNANVVAAHGLSISTPFAFRAPHSSALIDLTITVDSDRRNPDGPMVLRHEVGQYLTVGHRQPDASLLVDAGAFQFVINAGAGSIAVKAPSSEVNSVVSVLAEGFAMALFLTERSLPTLHANAVLIDDYAVAIAGYSGQGKSTTAALLMSTGAPSLADDLVRVDLSASVVAIYPGSRGLRLRPAAELLADELVASGLMRSHSADNRIVIHDARHTATTPIPLGAIVVPSPSRDISEVVAEVIAPAQAVVALLQATRVIGWLGGAPAKLPLETASELARRVPVVRLRVPWGPPWTNAIADQVRAVIERVVAM